MEHSDNKVLFFSPIFSASSTKCGTISLGLGYFGLGEKKISLKKAHGKFPAKVWVLFFRRDTTGAQGLAAGSSR